MTGTGGAAVIAVDGDVMGNQKPGGRAVPH